MSQWRGQIRDIDEPGDLVPLFQRYYHVPTLIGLLAFMLWSRVRDWENFVVGGTVYFSSNDPWYHYRMTSYTVEHWPETSTFDPWTQFPYGAHSSQFGTIFDQLMATAALVVGLGNPSDHTVRMVVLFAPAVLGVATAVPTYLIAKRVGGRFAGVAAVGVLAVFGSAFVARGTVGAADHHIAETFFMSVAVLATMVAVSVAEREKPVWELFAARDLDAVRSPLGWAVVAGAATAVYVWSWPPGVFLIGVLGVYYLLELSSLQAHGQSPEPVAIVGAVSMATTAVLTLSVIETVEVSATSFNVVQPGLALLVSAGCVFMAWLARQWDDRDVPDYQYPIAVGGIIAVLAGLAAVVVPDTFGFFVRQVQRVVGLTITDTAATVGEAQPLPFDGLRNRYGLTHFVTIAGVVGVFAYQFYRKPRSELLLLGVWTAFMLFATLTQQRFDYYLGVTVAVMTGFVLATVADFGGLFDSPEEIETYQVVSIVAIVVVVFAPLVFAQGGVLAMQNTAAGPGPSPEAWNSSMDWMQDNTPEEGNLAGAGNGIEYYGTFEATEDYEYEPGFYGVMSWWDYGHWITVMGERIPNANPFQQGANEAAEFLLSGSEDEANAVLDELEDGEGTETRYVAVDWKMVTTEQAYRAPGGGARINGKYFAPFQFHPDDPNALNYYERLVYRTGQGQNAFLRTFMQHKQPYYESTVVRLYKYHGSAVEPDPVVLDWEREDTQAGSFRVSQGVQRFDSMRQARNYTRTDGSSQVGGIGRYPQERVPAMEHYRLVGTSEQSALESTEYLRLTLSKIARGGFREPLFTQTGINSEVLNEIHATSPAWVKLFERVPGTTIQGQGPANTTVEASVQLRVPRQGNNTFVYTQRAETGPDGTFEMTVPYSTTGYEEWGTEEGYTDPDVRATGPYQFRTPFEVNESRFAYRFTGETHVTEGQVLGEDGSEPTVELERSDVTPPPDQNGTNGSATADDSTTDGQSETDTNGTNDLGASVAVDATGGAAVGESAGSNADGGGSTADDADVGGSVLEAVGFLVGVPVLGLFVFGRGR